MKLSQPSSFVGFLVALATFGVSGAANAKPPVEPGVSAASVENRIARISEALHERVEQLPLEEKINVDQQLEKNGWADGRRGSWLNGRRGGWGDGRGGSWLNGRDGGWADGRGGSFLNSNRWRNGWRDRGNFNNWRDGRRRGSLRRNFD